MDALRWRLRRVVRRLGSAGTIAIALLLATLGILVVGIFPLRSEVDRLRVESVERASKSSKTVQTMPPDQILAEELTAFHQRFPLVSELSDALDTLFSLAGDQGLEVNRGEYILVEKAGGILRRFEVTLPVAGTYSQIRGFVLDVLRKLPSTALVDIALERGKIAEGQAAVSLRFVFFVKKSG